MLWWVWKIALRELGKENIANTRGESFGGSEGGYASGFCAALLNISIEDRRFVVSNLGLHTPTNARHSVITCHHVHDNKFA